MISAFHHVSLLARHGKANSDFYTQQLGLRFVKNTVNQDNHRMPHYFFGDYAGTPGSLVTFFIVPLLGSRYDRKNYLATIGLKIPQDSLAFWETRLSSFAIPFTKTENTLRFNDPDGVELLLTETKDTPLPEAQQVKNDIPGEKQIVGLTSTEFHVANPEKTEAFFNSFLGWQSHEHKIFLNETDFIAILPSSSEETSRMGRGSMDHVAFAVESEKELEQLHQKAQTQGWEIEMYVNRGYFKSLYIREPGGNRVEFATVTPGFTIDEPLETLGEELALPPFLQSERAEIEANIYKDI